MIARGALDYPLIQARAAELGLTEPVFTELVGASLDTLRSDHGQRTTSLTVLVRLARLLELSFDELVLTDASSALQLDHSLALRPCLVAAASRHENCRTCVPS
ncbi:hypothetical protein [Amycolatopsis magusensis]|uniref:hypothetical protein n=1 Tax=Amycolatopsis magusensis TaxID=882444 RepID=UPI0037B7A97B